MAATAKTAVIHSNETMRRLIPRNRVLLLLTALLIAALFLLPFASFAPNRLVSGQPVMLTETAAGGELADPADSSASAAAGLAAA
ncbi:hypothetical protein LQ939_06770 [Pantoea alhagi]|nr:hypothetical protein LQ939_06770 [Pantoea alhagi]